MKNIILGIFIGVVAILLSYLNYRRNLKRKLKKSENKWLEYNRRTLGLSKKTLYNILGRGTEIDDNKILYVSELDRIGIVQTIYSINKDRCIESVRLKVKNTDSLDEVLASMRELLGEALIEGGTNYIWELGSTRYRLEKFEDSLDIEIRKF